MYDFYISDIKTEDIIELSYDENLDDVASSFSFTALQDYGLTTNNKINTLKICEKGSKKPFYCGIITTYEHTTDVNKYSYSGFDVGFYLNKNQVIKQFKNTNIGDAIEQLCKDYGINVPNMPIFTKTVTKNYKGEVFSDIIKEFLKLEKEKIGILDFYVDCKNGLFGLPQYELNTNLGSLIANQIEIDSFKTISNVNVKHSIQELKNKVVLNDNSGKEKTSETDSNPDSIETFGMLKYVTELDNSKENKVKQTANSILTELNVIKDTISLSMLGDYHIKSGIIIPLDIKEYELKGYYLITSSKHTLTSEKEVVDIELEKYNIN